MKYEKTDNPNVVKEVKVIGREIHLDKLEAEIKELQEQLKNIPKPKEKPDQETLDFWNEMMLPSFNKEELEEELREKEELLERLKGL